jgi:hypothetical protein
MEYLMKTAVAVAAVILLSAPASAQVLHQEQVDYNGREVTLHYALALDTSFQRVGAGPRTGDSCRWKSRVLVQRTAVDAQGKPIAVLSRTIDTGRLQEGSRVGHCAGSPHAGNAGSASEAARFRTVVAEVAGSDRVVLQSELASVDLLTGGTGGAK